jgi:hypothetical protein
MLQVILEEKILLNFSYPVVRDGHFLRSDAWGVGIVKSPLDAYPKL